MRKHADGRYRFHGDGALEAAQWGHPKVETARVGGRVIELQRDVRTNDGEVAERAAER